MTIPTVTSAQRAMLDDLAPLLPPDAAARCGLVELPVQAVLAAPVVAKY